MATKKKKPTKKQMQRKEMIVVAAILILILIALFLLVHYNVIDLGSLIGWEDEPAIETEANKNSTPDKGSTSDNNKPAVSPATNDQTDVNNEGTASETTNNEEENSNPANDQTDANNEETPKEDNEEGNNNSGVVTPTDDKLADINLDSCIKVHFIDVGQGDSILVELGTDTIMLIDAGCSTYYYGSVPKAVKDPYMAYIDEVISNHGGDIDYLIATHRDSDHINMLPGVLGKYQVNTIYMNDCYQTTMTQEEIDAEKISKTLIAVETAAESEPDCDLHEFNTPDDTVILVEGGDYKFTVYSAGNDGFAGARTKANSMSIYCLLEYGGRKVLFTGDAEVETEKWLIEKTGNDPSFDIDVVKVPHHGSTSSSCEEFIDYLHAEYGVIMSGKDNSYGLPKKEVVDRYEAHDVTLYNTQDDGTIVLYIDSEGDFCFVTEKSAEAAE